MNGGVSSIIAVIISWIGRLANANNKYAARANICIANFDARPTSMASNFPSCHLGWIYRNSRCLFFGAKKMCCGKFLEIIKHQRAYVIRGNCLLQLLQMFRRLFNCLQPTHPPSHFRSPKTDQIVCRVCITFCFPPLNEPLCRTALEKCCVHGNVSCVGSAFRRCWYANEMATCPAHTQGRNSTYQTY